MYASNFILRDNIAGQVKIDVSVNLIILVWEYTSNFILRDKIKGQIKIDVSVNLNFSFGCTLAIHFESNIAGQMKIDMLTLSFFFGCTLAISFKR